MFAKGCAAVGVGQYRISTENKQAKFSIIIEKKSIIIEKILNFFSIIIEKKGSMLLIFFSIFFFNIGPISIAIEKIFNIIEIFNNIENFQSPDPQGI